MSPQYTNHLEVGEITHLIQSPLIPALPVRDIQREIFFDASEMLISKSLPGDSVCMPPP